jgi:quercetin dioxygenase-like cupin family protein
VNGALDFIAQGGGPKEDFVNSPTLKPSVNPLYKIKQSSIIAECAEMRVIDQTLAPGEAVPWHLHPDSVDYIICLRGELEIRELNPDRVTTLRSLERYLIREKQPHTTVNASGEECQFLIVQGPGKVEFRALPKVESERK